MKKFVIVLLAFCFAVIAKGRTTQLLDLGWEFSNDSANWRAVDLPHDWSVEGPFAQDAPANNDGAYLPTGKGFYRKALALPEVDPGKAYKLYFEGVYMNSDVRVNGQHVGGHPYGYSSFFCDIAPALRAGDNIIEVSVDNSQQRNCRWYTGSGIYRHVWLIETEKFHVDPWSVYVTTLSAKPDSARVRVAFDVANELDEAEEVALKVALFDPEGNEVASKRFFSHLPAKNATANYAELDVPSPQLWDIDDPNLYTARITATTLVGGPVDEWDQPFGIRTIEFSPEGFLLNGDPLLINGACVHHDNGILGAASHDAAEMRKARLMKEAGFNAVRCSHNAPSPAFLDACDRVGLLVIDEVFDGWRDSKTEHDYAELIDSCWRDDIAAMVLRDRNHPSIIAWSIGNEVIERKKLEVVTTAHKLASLCRELDPTRPVTSALAAWDSDWEIYDPLAAELDITGYNYMIHKAEGDHQRVPGRVMWQTESYPRDALSNWRMAKGHPYIVGDFVWTGLDYLGESGIGRHYYEGEVPGEHWERQLWPWHGALCGDVDITGLRKPISHYRDFLWNRNEEIYMAVREPEGYRGQIKETLWGNYPTEESWNWPGWEGRPIEVEVVSSCPSVRLYLNGEFIGEQSTNDINGWKAVFTIPYEPGTLRAEGSGSVASTMLSTAGKPASIRLTPDRQSYAADGSDIAFVVAELVDAKGRVVPDSDVEINFALSGPGEIVGAGSADMKALEPYATPRCTTHRGRALVAIRTTQKKGKLDLRATAPNLSGRAKITASPPAP